MFFKILPKSLTKAKLAFFPYCVDREHWFACVSDFVKKTNFILDSNLPRRPDTRCKFLVETLFPALGIIARDFPGYKKLLQINNFPFVTVDVPRQKNGYSCGVYLLKFLENLSCQSLWSDQTCYENLDEYGESMIVDLIRWEENKRTALVCRWTKFVGCRCVGIPSNFCVYGRPSYVYEKALYVYAIPFYVHVICRLSGLFNET
ncbi:uncharacterized protein LOC141649184 [Silene latifolia]|uniref:uncharacterized protein LOC141649184 n=1 Tax=Silene latifolia TaxID=37657 RepID=UPI003D771138